MRDYTKAIEISPHIYWVGMYLENDPFQCHPYFIENGENSVLIDPGSMLEFDAVVQKINTISNMRKIKYIILHHQDPDVAASIASIEKLIQRDDLQVITHSRMVPLVKHYLIESDYYEIDKHQDRLIQDGLELYFLTTPYCHSPGAFVTYIPQNKILFSGDIFGGIEKSWDFYAKEDYFDKAKQFHAEYMPSRDIFNYALNKIAMLDLELIAPQHGSLIQKPYIAPLIQQMKELECGLYIKEDYHHTLIGTIEALKAKDIALTASLDTIKEREKLLFHKAKMADMGVMIGNIAHQWRQPLALNNTIISILKEKNIRNLLSNKELDEKLQEMEESIQYMSNTIDDFMHFYSPNKEKRLFNVIESLQEALKITKPMLQKITLKKTFHPDDCFLTQGYKNEYTQVLVSILTNAKDILLLRNVPNPYIEIFIEKGPKGEIALHICDNAGGIDPRYIDSIFDPYFTTKHQSVGTGLGLYISQMIIEQNMQGLLTVRNTKEGAQFTITMESYHEHQ